MTGPTPDPTGADAGPGRDDGAATTDGAALVAIDRDLVAEIWTSDEAYQNLVHLCDECGGRFAGTPGERAAAEFMAGRLRAYGLENVHLEEVPYTGWARGTARLETVSPERREFDCLALPYCPSGQVEGDLVFLGQGHPQDFEDRAGELRGAVAMLSSKMPAFMRREVHRKEKYRRAFAKGAAAFIWMREEGGLLVETGSLTFNEAAPTLGFGVSKEVGSALLRMARKAPDGKVRVRLTAENAVRPMVSWNVVGDIPGRRQPERVLIMGGHYDGHDISQGAIDDGSGVAVAMEAARGLARHKGKLDRTVRVVCFPLEEIGLIGSLAYVRDNPAEMAKVDFMLNLDGAGRGGDPTLILQGWTELRGLFAELAREMKQPLTVGSQVSPYSDMFPFAMAGVPSATLVSPADPRGGRGWVHTAADTLDKVTPRGLTADALTVARLFLRLANIADGRGWPARRKTPKELKALLVEQGLDESLKIEGRYPFPD